MSDLSVASAHNGQDADVKNVHVDNRFDGLELAISEVLVHETIVEDALGSRSDRRLFHHGTALWSHVLGEGDSRAAPTCAAAG